MDRTQLTNLIDSSRSVALDCYGIGRNIDLDDPVGHLFQTDALNKSIVLKQYEKVQPAAAKSKIFDAEFLKEYGGGQKAPPPVNVNTVIYFPYDTGNVYGGGESVVYSGAKFIGYLADKISHGGPSGELMLQLNADAEALDLLDAIPSLDPFLLRCKAEQIGVDGKIHADYFAVSKEEWQEIRGPIQGKIARLVRKALGDMEGAPIAADSDFEISVDTSAAEQDYITHFLEKIWHAKDVDGIEGFVEAMQIEPVDAPRVFFAWKAVCYFQFRFAKLTESLKTMFHWVGHDDLCYPADALQLSEAQRNRIVERRTALRERMRAGYLAANEVLQKYEHSYNQFVAEGKPHLFLDFLSNAEHSYLLLANHVSIATHSVNFWRNFLAQNGTELKQERFSELFDGLLVLYNVRAET